LLLKGEVRDGQTVVDADGAGGELKFRIEASAAA
jgi:hypothetical protein